MKSVSRRLLLLFALCIGLSASFKPSFSMGRKMHLSTRFINNQVKNFASHTIDGVTVEGEVHPLNDNIFVRVKAEPAKTASGLFLPTNPEKSMISGVVVAAGPGVVHPETAVKMNMPVSVGEYVLYEKMGSVELKYDDMPHQIISAGRVLLKFAGQSEEAELTLSNVECTNNHVLIELPPENGKTATGIIVSEKLPDTGKVVKVGPGMQAANGQILPMPVDTGDIVRFNEYRGTKVKIEGKQYLVLDSSDILAKIVADN